MNFINAFYFMIATASTIGFGDIYPTGVIGRTAVVIILVVVIYVFTSTVTSIVILMKESNQYNRYYKFKDHLVLMGTMQVRDLLRFILTLLDRKGVEDFPKILIVGEKRIETTDLERLVKNELLEKKIYYLSNENPIDMMAF